MYRITFILEKSSSIAFKEYETFKEAVEFAIKQPENSIIEIKHYDTQTNYVQNESNNFR